MRDLKSMTLEELEFAVEELGEKKFRAKQIFEWFHKRLASSLDEMNNLPKNLKEKLQKEYEVAELKEVETYVSKIDGTRKYLFQLNDGNIIESVLMKYKHGNSVCISSQAGCRMGCRFCASTLGGTGPQPAPFRNAWTDLLYPKRYRGTGVPCGRYGNRGTFG